jgi:hypothetical protein
MNLGSGLGHLTYSTLVHAGDTWEDMWTSLTTYVPQVKARVSPDEDFGLSLRLSASSAQTLVDSRTERQKLSSFLSDNGLYLYTANAFVYGGFKDQVVKERVYEPDWTTEDRVRYTINVADILAEVGRADVNPSIQTPPMAFKPKVTGEDVVDRITDNVLRVVAHLVELERRTGTTVTLAIEPEPHCFLETTDETVAYFAEHLYSERFVRGLAARTGLPISEANATLRKHLGVVYDVCHQAVEYEDPRDAIAKLVTAGIPIFKLQMAAALRVADVTQDDVDRLKQFAESIYLTQTVERRDGEIRRFLNMEDAFAAWDADPGPREWRTHFHVPVFLADLGTVGTTRFAIEEALALHREAPLSRQLEVETYTWDVLPDEFKTGDIVEYVSRELEFVRSELLGTPAAATAASAGGGGRRPC